jgi:hypothetical protein
MIGCKCAPKPAGFVERVEKPGKRWLSANPTGRPPNLWSPFKLQLAEAFGDLCAYSAMLSPVATVDHFVSVSEDRRRAYDWSNYRYCAGWLNAAKQDLRSKDLLDPFEVQEGWFEILLPSMQLVATDSMPKKHRARAELMLRRLHLRDDERVMRQRRQWLQKYEEGKLSLEGLAEMAPLIAAAVVKREQAAGRKKPRGKAGRLRSKRAAKPRAAKATAWRRRRR